MRYLITGHTGFKGAWLTTWLTQAGHVVSGVALDPEPGSLFERMGLAADLEHDFRLDIREADAVRDAVRCVQPDIIMHLAAQPLVRASYREPRWTIETNVIGTLNVLDATQDVPGIRARVIVTTDKVYRNINQIAGYVEGDPLGGDDPYSASKAMADILTQAWATSFSGPPTAIARAGNVIGGGDVCAERLVPDVLTALRSGTQPHLRYPNAVRPWQHVLDCLNGYLTLAHALAAGRLASPSGNGGSWNFGPDEDSFVTVGDVTDRIMREWGVEPGWIHTGHVELHEAGLLALDSSLAKRELNWHNHLPLAAALRWTVEWEKAANAGADARDLTERQLHTFRTDLLQHGSLMPPESSTTQ